MLVTQGEGSGTPTKSHHTPFPKAQQSLHHDLSSSLHPSETTKIIPTSTPTEIPTLRQYSRRATRIAQSKALPTAADEPASLLRDDREEPGVERSIKRGSNDTEEMVNVLTSIDTTNILTSGIQAVNVPPVAKVSTVSLVPTGSGLVPT
nr:hypothetical protein [Tanacetum cinerariifolium]